MTTRVTDGARRLLFSCQAAALVDARPRAFTPLTKSEEKKETARRLHVTYFGVLGKCFSLQLLNQKSCYFCQ